MGASESGNGVAGDASRPAKKQRRLDNEPERPSTSSDGEGDASGILARRPGGPLRKVAGSECPYLDTISRARLDFDFEKSCSVTLRKENVYACLVCGKYFCGRGPRTPAYTHALEEGHSIFMKLSTGQVFALPDGYEVVDQSLQDIKQVLNPTFSREDVASLDAPGSERWERTLSGEPYLPGMVGLNNLKATDYANVVVHALLRVRPFRDHFLLGGQAGQGGAAPTPLVEKFGELCRKMWNKGSFKGQVSPLEFLLAVQERSKKRFSVDAQADPVTFLSWLLNTLHFDLTGGKPSKRRSVVTRCFQGEMAVTELRGGGEEAEPVRTKFLMLGLDLPPAPLFRDAMEKNIIPQVPLLTLLKKYEGEKITEIVGKGRKKYEVTRVPDHLIVWAKRFTTNAIHHYGREKNPTIVTFPLRGLPVLGKKFDLVAMGCHEGKPEGGTHRAILLHHAGREWYQVEDLSVTDVRPETVAIAEAYFQIYSATAVSK